MPRVTFEVTADEAKALRAFQRIEDKQAALQRKQSEGTRKGKRGLDDMIGKASQYLIGLASIATAWQGITRTIEDAEQAARRAAETQTQLAGSEQSLRANLGGMSVAEQNAFVANVAGIADETGVLAQTLYGAAATAYSKAGGDADLALASVRAGAELAPESPARMNALAGTAISMQRATGDEDPYANIGMMQRIGDLSAVADPASQARMIPRAILPSLAYGADARSAGALFALFTQMGEDVTGERSASAATRVSQEFADFFEQDAGAQQLGADTLEERISALQGNREMAKRFILGAGELGGAISRGPMMQILTDPESEAAKEFANILSQLPSEPGEARARAEQMLAGRGQVTGEPAAELERRMQQGAEAAWAGQGMRGVYGSYAAQIGDVQQAAGLSWLDRAAYATERKANLALFGPEEALQRELNNLHLAAGFALERGELENAQTLVAASGDLTQAVVDELRGLRRDVQNISTSPPAPLPAPNTHVE